MAKYQSILTNPPWACGQKDRPKTVSRYEVRSLDRIKDTPCANDAADIGETGKEVEPNA